jgi:hypothetical protein
MDTNGNVIYTPTPSVTTKVSPSISLALASRAACVMVKLVSSFVLNATHDSANNTYTFTPAENFFGNVALSFGVNDGTQTTNLEWFTSTPSVPV